MSKKRRPHADEIGKWRVGVPASRVPSTVSVAMSEGETPVWGDTALSRVGGARSVPALALATEPSGARDSGAPFFADALGPEQRARALTSLRDEEFDLLVIGGGATGCGAALDAASRGLKVALVERADLASGTSSKSSKLVHGGLRYLEQLRFGLVREALRERELLLTTLAPHLVRPVSFLYPLTTPKWERPYVGAGIALYDVLGGGWGALPRHRHLSYDESMSLAPALRPGSLVGSIRYYDGQMDDARLNVAIARTAAEHGAVITTGTPVKALLRRGDRVAGAVVHDEDTDERIYVRARSVLACAGAWTDELYRLTGATDPSPLRVRASKGVHIVVPGSAIESSTGLVLRTERSVLFVMPWGDNWLVGTTDTPYDDASVEPKATAADVNYLLRQANQVLSRPLRPTDVLSTFAGLRPLVDPAEAGSTDTSRVSREHVITQLAPGLTAIAGGKWTTYRIMARDAVTETMRANGYIKPPRSRTHKIELTGARAYPATVNAMPGLLEELGMPGHLGAGLGEWYGSSAYQVLNLLRGQPELRARLAGSPDYLAGEVVYACRFDGARHLSDVLERRLRMTMSGPVPADTLRDVARLMADTLHWDDARVDSEIADYDMYAATLTEGVRAPAAAIVGEGRSGRRKSNAAS